MILSREVYPWHNSVSSLAQFCVIPLTQFCLRNDKPMLIFDFQCYYHWQYQAEFQCVCLTSFEKTFSRGCDQSPDTDHTETVTKSLKAGNFDCVMVGAGVRTNAERLGLFEQLVNLVHVNCPKAKICFNTGPFDSFEAVTRVMS